MGIKLVLVDLDGTILGMDQVKLSAANKQALEDLHARGCEIVPCTGRVVDMLAPELLALPYIRYVVSCHGARVFDRKNNETIYECVISPADSSRVLAVLEDRGLYMEVAANHTIYIEKDLERKLDIMPVPPHHVWYMRDQKCYTAVDCLSQYFLDNKIGIEKINLYGIPSQLQQTVFDNVTATGVIRHTRGAASSNLEFSAKNINKDDAIEALLKRLNISYNEVFAIGDSSTDVDVIRRARIGVAMGNAPDDIKQVADYVTAPNTEDGFAKAVRRYILNVDKE